MTRDILDTQDFHQRLDRLRPSDWARINVVGSSGSGKSTLARQLSDRLRRPLIEIDALFWGPDWSETPDETFLPKLETELSQASWVLDGNYHRTRSIKWRDVTLVIWLDPPFWRVLWQVLTRTLRRALFSEVLWSGNRESFTRSFLSKDSILWWSLSNLKTIRARYQAEMTSEDCRHFHWLRVRSQREMKTLLAKVDSAAAQRP
ncbi:MAG: adenylate kinase [Pseudomonadales bacterium]